MPAYRRIAYSFASATALLAALLFFFKPRWETNDDVAMSMIAHGYGIAADGSPPFLMFSNILWGYLVRLIPEWSGTLGYSSATVFVLALCGGVFIYGLTRLGAGRITVVALVLLTLARPVLFPQFTINSGLLMVAAVLILRLYTQDNRNITLSCACMLAFFSFLIRSQEFLFVLVVALPLISWREIWRRRSAWVCGAILLVGIAGATVFDRQAYRAPAWDEFNALNPVRAALTDFRAGDDLRARPDLLQRSGLTANDIRLVESWFFVDPRVADPGALYSMLSEIGFTKRSDAGGGAVAALGALFNPVLVCLALAAILLGLLRWNRKIAVAWLLFLAGILALGLLGRPAVFRVYIPALTLLLFAPYVIANGSRTVGKLGTAALVLGAVVNAGIVFSESRAVQRVDDVARNAIEELPHVSLVVWGGSFPFQAVYPVIGVDDDGVIDRTNRKIYGLGVSTLAPFSVAWQEARDGRGLVQRLASLEGVPIMANELLFGYLKVYCEERHRSTLEELQSASSGPYTLSWRRCRS
ncbi:MAG: hypothetical protein WKG52_01940 [Variovorax sp.]